MVMGAEALASVGGGLATARASRSPFLVLPGGPEEEVVARPRGAVQVGPERCRKAPKKWAEWCLKLGGRNLYGEPVLRIVWSEDRRSLVGGEWWKWDASGNWLASELRYDLCLKYPGERERWLLEMWMPPDAFGGREWWESFHRRRAPWGETYLVQPIFPSRGEYESIATFSDPETGGYAEPTESDLPGLLGLQKAWREKDPLARFYELRNRLAAQEKATNDDVEAASREESRRLRAETYADLGWRPRTSLAGLDIPRRSTGVWSRPFTITTGGEG